MNYASYNKSTNSKRNLPSIAQLTRGANYTLKHGQPYSFVKKPAGWTNGDRVLAASRVINGENIKTVAYEVGCCKLSIKNWIKTLNGNNPRLEG